jgi:hypothetical protein
MSVDVAKVTLKHAKQWPYNGRQPVDTAEWAALGVLHDLCDRRGIKHELHDTDDDIKEEIVTSLAAIIRSAFDGGSEHGS